jgi:hypothetical protein
LFTFWHTPMLIQWDWILWTVALVVAIVGMSRHRLEIGKYFPAVLATTFLATELSGVHRREALSGF